MFIAKERLLTERKVSDNLGKKIFRTGEKIILTVFRQSQPSLRMEKPKTYSNGNAKFQEKWA
mgnify:CR=1 FL=1